MATLTPGTVLENRYEIQDVLGEGGMGAVYRVADQRLSRKPWALKQVPLQAGLRQEANLLATLDNEHLPRVVDYFEADEDGFLVMELVEGATLEDHVRSRGPLSVPASLEVARQLCDALHYLHGHVPPVIFRDLKPANVMLAPGHRVKLVDFGIARLFSERKSQDTVALGTPGYAAPEQYGKGQSDVRTDIYGLGATLYFTVSGLDPSDQSWPLKPLHRAFPKIPRQLSDVIERCTHLDPEQRFQSVTEVRQALTAKAAPTRVLKTRQPLFARAPRPAPAPLSIQPARLDFGTADRRTTRTVPLSIQGPRVQVRSDTPWVRVRRRKGVWFAEFRPWAVPTGGLHQGSIRVVSEGQTHHLPVRVQMEAERASPSLKVAFFVLTALTVVPAAGLLFFLGLLGTFLSYSRDVRREVVGFFYVAMVLAVANLALSGLGWMFFQRLTQH